MRLKIDQTRAALHPSEVVVVVRTINGEESLVVDRSSIKDDSLEIGQPVGQDDRTVLVELPRETNSGTWRVWVNADKVVGLAA